VRPAAARVAAALAQLLLWRSCVAGPAAAPVQLLLAPSRCSGPGARQGRPLVGRC
jgi:hypothetical protein